MTEGGWGPTGTGAPPPANDGRGSSVGSKVAIAAVAAVLGIGGGAAGVWLVKGAHVGASLATPTPTPSIASPALTASQVQLESTASTGPNPFTSPVGQDQSTIARPANTGGTFMGDTPGLFADTGDKPSCDTQTLIANLEADPAKETAWATALGLQASDIPTYIPSLTPVVLRSDTAVTSYGYADGRFFAYPAVLQAGTAVFVNSHGEPKAKCFSGNPLTQPQFDSQASFVGAAWEQFSPQSVTIIVRTPVVIKEYVFVDSHNGSKQYHKAKEQKVDDFHPVCDPDKSNSCKAIVYTPPATQCKDKDHCAKSSDLVNNPKGGATSECPNKDATGKCAQSPDKGDKATDQTAGNNDGCQDGKIKKDGKCVKPDKQGGNNPGGGH